MEDMFLFKLKEGHGQTPYHVFLLEDSRPIVDAFLPDVPQVATKHILGVTARHNTQVEPAIISQVVPKPIKKYQLLLRIKEDLLERESHMYG